MAPEDEMNPPSFALSRQQAVVAHHDREEQRQHAGCRQGLQQRPDSLVGADEGACDLERTQEDHQRSGDPQGTRQPDHAADQTTPEGPGIDRLRKAIEKEQRGDEIERERQAQDGGQRVVMDAVDRARGHPDEKRRREQARGIAPLHRPALRLCHRHRHADGVERGGDEQVQYPTDVGGVVLDHSVHAAVAGEPDGVDPFDRQNGEREDSDRERDVQERWPGALALAAESIGHRGTCQE